MPDLATLNKPTTPLHSGHRKRLRERFLNQGAKGLHDYELLEIILFAARPMGDVKPLAKSLIKEFGSLARVMHAENAALLALDGVNEAAVAAIKAVKASCDLLLKEPLYDMPIIKGWTALLDYCRIHMGHNRHEEFHILFLNNKLALIADEVQSRGTVDQTPLYPREVMKRALELSATAVILVHNHPSGDSTPSKEDIALTKQVVEAGKSLNIAVHDHVIVTAGDSFSFRAHGLI
jgi:DNA repair protein RadC